MPTKRHGTLKDFHILRRELKKWHRLHGTPGVMPTARALRHTGRHDLVNAICLPVHGGFYKVADNMEMGWKVKYKPVGHWDDPDKLKHAIFEAIEQHGEPGVMPTHGQLIAWKMSGLSAAISDHGGFPAVAKRLGLKLNRKENGYWTDLRIELDVRQLAERLGTPGVIPTGKQMRLENRSDLDNAIWRSSGKLRGLAKRMGWETHASKPNDFWPNPLNIDAEIRQFMDCSGLAEYIPTQDECFAAGRLDIVNALFRYGGGTHATAERLGLKVREKPKGYWLKLANVAREIATFNVRRNVTRVMPTADELSTAEEWGLMRAIENHGGYPSVRRRLGLKWSSPILRPYSRDQIYLAYELGGFFNPELEVEVSHRCRAVDIVLREQFLIIEYDGSHFHAGNEEKDERKTDHLTQEGWHVIRVREKPLRALSSNDVTARPNRYKETANRVLQKIEQMLGTSIKGLSEYLALDGLVRARGAQEFIDAILRDKVGPVSETKRH
ncbi:MAG: endonuclease domain-containing protein [Planctomycetes bacterium]|nr:endonuclease domain-containing protein [Planctomycetota bacterium]